MTAVVCPSEEELYLLAILTDESGLDQAEFAWNDSVNDHGRYRAWDFQWPWYHCEDRFQVDQGARSLGKTVSIVMRSYAFPFLYPGQSMLVTAPELNHLQPLTIAIEERLLNSRFTREMLPKGAKTNGINKTPHWQATFTNGTKIVSRLPNKDGKGVKGQHVVSIELDEAQDYPLAGWIEVVETLNRGVEGSSWHCHGVPKGVRDKFYDMTEGSEHDDTINWTVHRPMAFMKPNWSPEERAEKIVQYGGSRQNIDYKRNIYGEHGDSTNSVFVLARLMACVDTDEGSMYNQDVYRRYKIEYEDLPSTQGLDEQEAMFTRQDYIERVIAIPGSHKVGWSQRVGTREVGATKGYSAYWAGMDVGVTNHPSEILLYGQRKESDQLDLLLRVNLHRIKTGDQKFVVQRLFELYGPDLKAFALDKTGVGQPVWADLTDITAIAKRVHGFGFSENRVTGFEDRELVDAETKADLAIMRNVVEASTDWLRNDYVDNKRMLMPFDREILLEFQGQTYTVIKDNGSPYGKKRLFGGGSFHTLDAAKMMMAGKYIPPLEAMLTDTSPQPDVLDMFIGQALAGSLSGMVW